MFNILILVSLFYFFKKWTGVIFLLIIFAVDCLVAVIRRRFAHRIDPFVASLRDVLESLVKR